MLKKYNKGLHRMAYPEWLTRRGSGCPDTHESPRTGSAPYRPDPDMARSTHHKGGGTIAIVQQYSTYSNSVFIKKRHKDHLQLPGVRLAVDKQSDRIVTARDESVLRVEMGIKSSLMRPQASTEFETTLRAYSIIGELNLTQKRCLQKFINLCMKHGKKNKSYRIISNTLRRLSLLSKSAVAPIDCEREKSKLLVTNGQYRVSIKRRQSLLVKAIENVRPIVEVKKVRVSGTTQLVPSIIPKSRQICLALRWIIEAAILRRNTKKNITMDECFFAELIDASKSTGTVRKKRDDLHKLAESNRGFAHYRWWV